MFMNLSMWMHTHIYSWKFSTDLVLLPKFVHEIRFLWLVPNYVDYFDTVALQTHLFYLSNRWAANTS